MVVQWILNANISSLPNLILLDIVWFNASLKLFEVKHLYKEANAVADWLASIKDNFLFNVSTLFLAAFGNIIRVDAANILSLRMS